MCKVLLFLVFWALFIELGLGSVYLIIAAIVFIFLNTRKRRETEKNLSAYSVFNPNFEELPGQFNSKHVERVLIGAY